MSTVTTIVRLRWALTVSTLKQSKWQAVSYIISWLLGVAMIFGVFILAQRTSRSMGVGNASIGSTPLSTIMVLVGFGISCLVIFCQLIYIGSGSSLSSKDFTLYGIPDRQLQMGTLCAGLSGTPAITGLLSLVLWTAAYAHLGAASVMASFVAAPLAIVTLLSISNLLVSVSGALIASRRGKNIFYVAVVLASIVLQIPALMTSGQRAGNASAGSSVASIGTSYDHIARAISWTPFGAAFQLPFDAFGKSWLAFIGHLAILVLTCLLCFVGSMWCLRHERLYAGKGAASVKVKGIGPFGWMPNSVSGAVSARLLTYLKRDPRQGLQLLLPLVVVVVMSFRGYSEPLMPWMSLLLCGWLMPLTESNGLSYDGRGFIMQALTGVPGRDDRRGRVRVYGVLYTLYLLVIACALLIFTGFWNSLSGLTTAMTYLGAALALAFSSLGLSEMASCLFMYPVPPLDKPFATPQGRVLAQMLLPFLFMFLSFVVVAPTGIVALAVLFNWEHLYWVIGLVGLANGLVVLFLGSWLGGRLMDSRLLSIVDNLNRFAVLSK